MAAAKRTGSKGTRKPRPKAKGRTTAKRTTRKR